MPVFTLEADYHPGLPWAERINLLKRETKLGLRSEEARGNQLKWSRQRLLRVLRCKSELPVPRSRFDRILDDD